MPDLHVPDVMHVCSIKARSSGNTVLQTDQVSDHVHCDLVEDTRATVDQTVTNAGQTSMIFTESRRLSGTYQSSLSMVDMSNDGNVADVILVCQNIAVNRFFELSCKPSAPLTRVRSIVDSRPRQTYLQVLQQHGSALCIVGLSAGDGQRGCECYSHLQNLKYI